MSVPEDFLQRRPYNAAADFVDANVARGLGGKIAFIDAERVADLWRAAGAHLPVRGRACSALGLRPEDRICAPALRHGRLSGRVLGRGARRHRRHPAQHAADRRAVRLHPGRQPRRRAGGGARRSRKTIAADPRPRCRGCAPSCWSARAPTTRRRFPAATSICSRTCSRASGRRRSPRRRSPTRSRSGCTRRARPAIPRASSTSTPRRWRPRG